jgi:hypothetical protein
MILSNVAAPKKETPPRLVAGAGFLDSRSFRVSARQPAPLPAKKQQIARQQHKRDRQTHGIRRANR